MCRPVCWNISNLKYNKETFMADHQLQPFENVELGEKQDQLQV